MGRRSGVRPLIGASVATGILAFAGGGALAGVTGKLSFLEAEFEGQGGVTGLANGWDVAVTPNGRTVYTTSTSMNSLVVFKRNRETGKVRYLETEFDGVNGVEGIADSNGIGVAPGSRHVYVTGFDDDAVAIFRRNPDTGKVKFVGLVEDGVGGVDGLVDPVDAAVSPDGENVYVTAFEDDAIATFSRNSDTGQLSFQNARFDGVDGVDGLDGAAELDVSDDGKNVYVASQQDDAIASFSRDQGTGQLAFMNAKFNGIGAIEGLDGAFGIDVSPDGRSVYSESPTQDAVVTFRRNPTTGNLAFVNARFNGMNDVVGLDEPYEVIVSPDNRNVYATGNTSNALVAFKRNLDTGGLRFQSARFDGRGPVDGLDGAYLTTASPKGDNLYVIGSDEGALAVFRRQLP